MDVSYPQRIADEEGHVGIKRKDGRKSSNRVVALKTLLATTANLLAGAGVAEWLSRQPRDQTKEG